jgi:next-to-BRCA1 protein 1
MATSNPTNPDTLITVKVAINGSNRRFKLALRDLGANIFPQRVRISLLTDALLCPLGKA